MERQLGKIFGSEIAHSVWGVKHLMKRKNNWHNKRGLITSQFLNVNQIGGVPGHALQRNFET